MFSKRVGIVGALFIIPAFAQVSSDSGAASGTKGYRHGLVPMMSSTTIQTIEPVGSNVYLRYRGGLDGVSVTTGKPKVFLVFWGTQWGTRGVDGNGRATFTGDSAGVAPALQAFFQGLGTGSELWSGVMTQYCEGIATGSTTCLSTDTHVGYPLGGALAGVWEDTSVVAPAKATAHQIAEEAAVAAVHFGRTTEALNVHVQYVVVSPTGTNPDGYKTSGFCAWHDFTGDATMDGGGSVGGPLLAFTNLPYLPDIGANCGAGFVNPGDNLDGVTIVEGHEYAETITDQFPAGGWTNNTGAETGDICAWVTSGPGRVQNISLTTGTFAVQGTWSNLNSRCSVSHAVVK